MKTALQIIRTLLLGLMGLVVTLVFFVVAVLYLAVDTKSSVSSTASFTPAHIERAKRLLDRNDPRRMRSGVLRTITVSEADLDLAVNYAANRFGKGSSKIELADGHAHVLASVPLQSVLVTPFFSSLWSGRQVNIDANLSETAVLPQFDGLKIGQLPIPAFIANRVLRTWIEHLQRSSNYGAATDTIKNISSRNGMLSIVYEWNEAVPDQLAGVLVPVADQLRMQAYQARLVELAGPSASNAKGNDLPTRGRTHPPIGLRLGTLVQALLRLAQERGGDATSEHRAAIIVMAFYVNGKGLGAIIPAARRWTAPMAFDVTLTDRSDFAQHFTISAALAATAGSPLADAVGLYKELDDSRTGSGFSFSDLAADRAGTRFGEIAAGPNAGGEKIQRLLLSGVRDEDLIPDVKDLPEFLQEADFKRRYGGVATPAYTTVMKDIDRRIASLPLYRR